MPEPTSPPDLAPRARALSARVDQQIGQPAALLVPAGVRSVVRELADLVHDMAAQLDHLKDRQQ
jgi:hypothetical protein